MATNLLGILNNNTIVPYTATTKRTKQVTVTSASDITLAGTGITTSSIGHATLLAYADSLGVWFVKGAMRINRASGTGSRNLATVTFTGSYPFTFSGDQAATVFASSTGVACTAQAISGTATIQISHTNSDEGGYQLNFDCKVQAKPTWADANMEGVVAADVFIAPAAAGTLGLIDNTAGNIVGNPIKGRTDGSSPSAGYVGERITWDADPPSTASVITNTSYTDWAKAFLTLNKGRYQLLASVPASVVTGTSANNDTTLFLGTFLGDGTTLVDKMEQYVYARTPTNAATAITSVIVLTGFINVTSDNTIVKLRYKWSNTGAGFVYNEPGAYAKFVATRTD
jgi:hypothetical protein